MYSTGNRFRNHREDILLKVDRFKKNIWLLHFFVIYDHLFIYNCCANKLLPHYVCVQINI